MPVNHYENFPVASILLPARLRPAVQAIYAFARSADDLADEGECAPALRLAALAEFEQALAYVAAGPVPPPGPAPALAGTRIFRDLAHTLQAFALPAAPLFDLLSAFRQDVGTTRYADFGALSDYCRRSANPVGRLMLALYGIADETSLRQSDAICSALQLINFWQDVAIDIKKQRIYIPREDLQRFGVHEQQIVDGVCDEPWRALMAFEVARARTLMASGAPLARRLPGRLGWELRLVVQGGLRIATLLERNRYDVFRRRPRLDGLDWLRILWRALWMAP